MKHANIRAFTLVESIIVILSLGFVVSALGSLIALGRQSGQRHEAWMEAQAGRERLFYQWRADIACAASAEIAPGGDAMTIRRMAPGGALSVIEYQLTSNAIERIAGNQSQRLSGFASRLHFAPSGSGYQIAAEWTLPQTDPPMREAAEAFATPLTKGTAQ